MDAATAQRYPPDALSGRADADVIEPETAGSLPGLFLERLRRDPDSGRFREFDTAGGHWQDYSYRELDRLIRCWHAAFVASGLEPGDRVAILHRNSRHWVIFDNAAMRAGLVVVPLYVEDRAENAAYILEHSGARLLFLENDEHLQRLETVGVERLAGVELIIVGGSMAAPQGRAKRVAAWLEAAGDDAPMAELGIDDLATIVYTSGTTGRPKGVMLSHRNLLANSYASMQSIVAVPDDLFLSFLPLSHALERMAGYYVAVMCGATIAYSRSINDLADDIVTQKPTILVSVPRIFERVHARIQERLADAPRWRRWLFERAVEVGWARFEHGQGRGPWRPAFLLWPVLDRLVARRIRGRMGGRIRGAISGGAPLPPAVGRVLLALDVPVLQGYGLTECAPVLSVNALESNKPASIGLPLHGVSLKIGKGNELLARGPNVMLGYWRDRDATEATFTGDGWLRTGDCARLDEDGFLYIIGRVKEILVLSNGEKVPPADMESAISADPLFIQCMVVGEGKPYLSALVVLNTRLWAGIARKLGVDPDDAGALDSAGVGDFVLERIGQRIGDFPGFAQIYRVAILTEPWTVDNDLLTPTLKIKRQKIRERFAGEIEKLYAGH